MQKQANGPHDVGLLMAIDGLIRSSDRDKLATLRVIDPGAREQVPAGVYWVRASVDRNILVELGRDPAAMTRREYWRQGASFNALCAAWVFSVEVAQERARHEAALKRQHARAAKALLGQVRVNGHVH